MNNLYLCVSRVRDSYRLVTGSTHHYLVDVVTCVNKIYGFRWSGKEVFHVIGKFVKNDQNQWIRIDRRDIPYCADNRDMCP